MSDLEKKLQAYTAAKRDRQYQFQQYSPARLGMGHTGGHLLVKDWLAFQADFALAKDALCSELDVTALQKLCAQLNLTTLEVASQTNNFEEYLLRPDKGRLINEADQTKLTREIQQHPDYAYRDILLVISGGLSPSAVQHQIPAFLPHFVEAARQEDWTLAPVIINPRGRVAFGDQLNALFKAQIVVMLIGERPGLTTPDSMSIYFTYGAEPGFTDERRNCISNIHQHGLRHLDAVAKLILLLKKSRAQKASGIVLKDGEIMGVR